MQNHVITHYVKAPFTVNGDTSQLGVITVSAPNAALLWPGARVYVGSNTQSPVEALILEDLGGGKFRVRLDDQSVGVNSNAATDKAGSPRAVRTPGGGSSWAAFTVADAAYITQPQGQMIFNYSHDGVVPRVASALTGQ